MATKEQWGSAEIVIDRPHAFKVLERMLATHRERTYPFSFAITQLPQKRENLPGEIAWHSRDHAMFLFILCLWMRGGIKSDVAGIKLGNVFKQDPRWFDPYWAQHQDPDDLLAHLKASGLAGLAKTNARYWIENCRRLCETFAGDPVNILRGVTDYDTACARIKNSKRAKEKSGFMGFQEKMVSMLIYFLVDCRFPGLENFMFPVPVDIHVFRILISHEILVVNGLPPATNLYDEPVLGKVRDFFVEYCMARYLDAISVADTLWLWSRTLCSLNPGNKSRKGKGTGRNTEIIVDPVDWKNPSVLRAYQKSCGSCVVQGSCKWNLPAAIYYTLGRAYPHSRRLRSPNSPLFSLSLVGTDFVPQKKPEVPRRVRPALPGETDPGYQPGLYEALEEPPATRAAAVRKRN